MTSPKENKMDVAGEKLRLNVGRVIDGGLQAAVRRAGGELTGFSVKCDDFDCLVVLKANFPAGAMVGFVGGETIGGTLLKAAREAKSDGVRWREDRYRT